MKINEVNLIRCDLDEDDLSDDKDVFVYIRQVGAEYKIVVVEEGGKFFDCERKWLGSKREIERP